MAEQQTSHLAYGAKIVLYGFAALLPIWFLPLPLGIEFGREITLGGVVLLGAILWLLSILTTGEIRFRQSIVLYAFLVFLAAFGVSTLLSARPLISLLFAEASAEKFSTLVMGVVLAVVMGGVIRSQRDTVIATAVLFSTAIIGSAVTLVQLFLNRSLFEFLSSFAGGIDFNPIGTINGFSLFLVALLVMAVELFVSPGAEREEPQWFRLLLWVAVPLFLANLLLINFLTSWIVFLGATVVFFGLNVTGMRGERHRGGIHWIAVLILALSAVMIVVRIPLKEFAFPLEVSPSLGGTYAITKEVFNEGSKTILFGNGPGSFSNAWARYKDISINQNIFWNIRFSQGFSWAATTLTTGGVIGFLSLILLFGTAAAVFLRTVVRRAQEGDVFAKGYFLGFVALLLTAFLYPANLSLLLLFFFIIGMLSVLVSEEDRGWLAVRDRVVHLESPWAVFVSSLLCVFLVALAMGGMYLGVSRVRAALAMERSARSLEKGEIGEAISHASQAIRLEGNNYRNHQVMVRVRIVEIRDLIQKALGGKDVQQQFQSSVSLAIQDAQRAADLQPNDPGVWSTQGSLYEIITPFFPGAEQFAFGSYQKAIDLEPLNPALHLDLGRAKLVYADAAQLALNQGGGTPENRQALEERRLEALQGAAAAFRRAAEVKPDFASAHFLLAQTAIRLGDIQAAIQSGENAKLVAPFDIGVAFQLGLLYYQRGELDRAEAEFERAVSMNENYSNARYFLGLIYDRQGNKDRAIEEFENIEVFNPDNGEVKKILKNLREGKSALDAIVPPNPPPESRKEPPVREALPR